MKNIIKKATESFCYEEPAMVKGYLNNKPWAEERRRFPPDPNNFSVSALIMLIAGAVLAGLGLVFLVEKLPVLF